MTKKAKIKKKFDKLLAKRFNQTTEAEKYSIMAEKTVRSFFEKFWNPKGRYLFDLVRNGQKDSSFRPNQVFAVALDFTMLDKVKDTGPGQSQGKVGHLLIIHAFDGSHGEGVYHVVITG